MKEPDLEKVWVSEVAMAVIKVAVLEQEDIVFAPNAEQKSHMNKV